MSIQTPVDVKVAGNPIGYSGGIPLRATFWLALVNVLWAASAINVKIALGAGAPDTLGAIGPFTVAFLRFALAIPFLFILLKMSGHSVSIAKEDMRPFLLMGVIGLAVAYPIFYGGMQWTTATESVLLVGTEPILLALLARLILGERLSHVQEIGMALGFCCIYLIVCQGMRPHISLHVLGNLAIAAALGFESYGGVIGKQLTVKYPGLVILTVQIAIASVALFPFAAGEVLTHNHGLPHGRQLLAIGYMVVVCTFFCYAVWFHMLQKYNVSSMAAFLFIQPVMGPIYGYLFFSEHLHVWSAVGGGIVIVGVWLVAIVGARPARNQL